MSLKLKVLGQTASLTNSNIILYGVPYFMNTVISSLNICNRSSSPASFDIAFRKQGANLSSQHYFSYRTPIYGNESINIPAGITLDQSDLVVVSANNSSVSFSLFGTEERKQGFESFPVIEYLIVAGGGSASSDRGGGAGGYQTGSFITPMTGNVNYSVVIGAGGSYASGGTTGNESRLQDGILSSSIVSLGGGGGTKSGGSGGGGNVSEAPSQGNDGDPSATGGGGGAGAPGSGKNGGVGLYTDISGTYRPYSGGGGGGDANGTGGNGGDGGGGRGRGSLFGTAGSYGNNHNGGTNSGGGGGTPGTDGSGGSGVVIIRYSNTFPIASGNVGSVNYLESNGYRIYTFTSSATIQF